MAVREIGGILRLSDKSVYRAIEQARRDLGEATMRTLLLEAVQQGWLLPSERLTKSGAIAISVAGIARGERQSP
jgi:hypothetical protein